MFCTNGILFDHESPLRALICAEKYLTIILQIVRKKKYISLNINAKRTEVCDYVEAMWLMIREQT